MSTVAEMTTVLHVDVSRPADLPDLRLHLLDEWRPPNGPFFRSSRVLNELLRISPDHKYLDPKFDTGALAKAQLWWVTRDMSRLVDHAAKSLPPTTLTDDLVEDKCGFAVFAEPLVGIDTEPAIAAAPTCTVRAMLWDDNRAVGDGRRALTISMYTICDTPPVPGEQMLVNEGDWMPIGRTDWIYGADTEAIETHLDTHQGRRDSMAEDRRWFAALQLLASEERVAETTDAPVSRHARRRSERAGHSSNVRYVDLRAPKRAPSESEESRPVDWKYRWIVGGETGGFWRQQPYGPGRAYRRPKWILPFTKGPEGRPLKIKDTVKILRPDEQ